MRTTRRNNPAAELALAKLRAIWSERSKASLGLRGISARHVDAAIDAITIK